MSKTKELKDKVKELFESWSDGFGVATEPLIEDIVILLAQVDRQARIDELEWIQIEGSKINHCDSRELQLKEKLVRDRLAALTEDVDNG